MMGADPVIVDQGNMQSHNRYSYVYNNPLKHIDPSGYCGDLDCRGSEAVNSAIQSVNHQLDNFNKFVNWSVGGALNTISNNRLQGIGFTIAFPLQTASIMAASDDTYKNIFSFNSKDVFREGHEAIGWVGKQWEDAKHDENIQDLVFVQVVVAAAIVYPGASGSAAAGTLYDAVSTGDTKWGSIRASYYRNLATSLVISKALGGDPKEMTKPQIFVKSFVKSSLLSKGFDELSTNEVLRKNLTETAKAYIQIFSFPYFGLPDPKY